MLTSVALLLAASQVACLGLLLHTLVSMTLSAIAVDRPLLLLPVRLLIGEL